MSTDDFGLSSTMGHWKTEVESVTALDEILNDLGLWTLYPEVTGTLVHPRPVQNGHNQMRIDRVLVPKTRLVEMGWSHGIIGIEAKRSGVPIGPPISQMMDYSRAVWRLPVKGGIRVYLDWIFLWPMTRQSGPLESVLAQNRVGSANSSVASDPFGQGRSTAKFKLESGGVILRAENDGTVSVGKHALNGRKVGSR